MPRSNHCPSHSRFADQSLLLQGEPGATAPSIIASTTRRSNRTLECTSVTSGMHDDVSTNVALVAMKMKYAATRSMSRSTATRTQPSSQLPVAMLQLTVLTTSRGPRHSQGRSEHFSAPWF